MAVGRTDDIILICGKRRSGKSYWLKRYLDSLRRYKMPYVMWDYKHEYECPAQGVVVYEVADVQRAYDRAIPFIYYRPRVKTFTNLDLFCRVCYQFWNLTVVIEEVERYATSYKIPPNLKKIIDVGREHGLGLIVTVRRTMRLHADIPYNANHILIFRQTRPQDLRYMATFVGDGVYGLPKMHEHAYFHYDDSTGTLTAYAPIT